jgi:hypothetical protein
VRPVFLPFFLAHNHSSRRVSKEFPTTRCSTSSFCCADAMDSYATICSSRSSSSKPDPVRSMILPPTRLCCEEHSSASDDASSMQPREWIHIEA